MKLSPLFLVFAVGVMLVCSIIVGTYLHCPGCHGDPQAKPDIREALIMQGSAADTWARLDNPQTSGDDLVTSLGRAMDFAKTDPKKLEEYALRYLPSTYRNKDGLMSLHRKALIALWKARSPRTRAACEVLV